MTAPFWMAGTTTHTRRAAPRHRFSHAVDYVFIDPEADGDGPALFSRNRFNLAAVHDRDHGFAPLEGPGWARHAAAEMGFQDARSAQLRLLTAPRLVGLGFNPVSFWFFLDRDGRPRAVIAEVNNTFGDRHAYLCHLPGFPPLGPDDAPVVRKVLHVSPFRDIAGDYAFRFDLNGSRVAIRISHRDGTGGLVASLSGRFEPARNRHVLRALLRQPVAPLRTLTLIHWHALGLWRAGARFRPRPSPPTTEISR